MEVQPAALPIMPVSTASPSSSTTAPMPLSPQKSASTTPSDATTAPPSITTSPSTPNDPYPTWTFFPESATYTPPVYPTTSVGASPGSPLTIPSSPPRSPRSSPPPQTSNASGNGSKGQASSSTTSASTPSSTTASSSTPSTHHRILDHCFHVSIETRLQQAEAQYQASRQELAVEQQATNGVKQDDWRKRQRSLVDEAVVLGRKGSNLEAIVDGKQCFFLSFICNVQV